MKMPIAKYTLIGILFCASAAQAQVENVRFGNLHSHSSYSDGLGEPAEAYEMACDAGLDFFAVTEHNHAAGDGKGERRDGLMIATEPQLSCQRRIFSLRSQSTIATWLCFDRACASRSALVVLPVPPFGFIITITGIPSSAA